ncbi:MAG: hypothetical protein ABJB86_20000, partial [Bacteroidota bacterium]
FSSNSPISGVDQDGLEWSPAGKVGIFKIDQTAVQLYPDNPNIILQQKADAPFVHMMNQFAHLNTQPTYVSTKWEPKTDFEKQTQRANTEIWYDRDGFNADGSPKPLTRLANNKTWKAFANHLALPFLDLVSYAGGEGEVKGLIEGASRLTTREGIASLVDALFSSSGTIKELDAKAIVGYRGSLATGVKYKTGAPFNPLDFDVDGFIVSDKLAKQIGDSRFRDGRKISDLKGLSSTLENIFKEIPGYRTEVNKPFTFRVFTKKEFKSIVKKNGYKTF